MQTNSSHLSQNSGNDEVSSQQLFVVVLVIVLVGASFIFGMKHFNRSAEDQAAKELCRVWAGKIIKEAKQNPPELGTYEAVLPVEDSWGNQLTSTFLVQDLSNTVYVRTVGRDKIKSGDDQFYKNVDIHVRKSLVKGIESGTHAAGKGLTTGIIEGLGEATDASLKKAKAGAKKVKNDLMNRFKKKESNDENG